jgi:DNA-directed RNA polymerase specialized sigma24 family protein
MDESGVQAERSVFKRLPRENVWLDYLRRAASGDDKAFASLYDETNTMVYGLAMRMLANVEDAEEVTLDVYNQVWRIAKSFDAGRGTVTSWLMTLTRTRSLDKLRARRTAERVVAAAADCDGGAEPAPARSAEGAGDGLFSGLVTFRTGR